MSNKLSLTSRSVNGKAGEDGGSPTRVTREPRLATGLDTLKMTFWVDFSSSMLFHRLEAAKKQAQEEDIDSLPIDLGGYEFNLMRTGVQMFQFRLIRGDVRVLLSPRKHNSSIPNMKLEIGSISCWTPGYNKVYQETVKLIEFLGGVFCKEKVSEFHTCVDVIGQDIKETPAAFQDHWITRAQTFNPHYRHRKLTGVSIGSGDLMLRIYDKVEEIKRVSQHKKEPFMEVWGIDDFESAQVTRVEFQVRRPIIKEFKIDGKARPIDTLKDLNNSLSSIWSYLINEWARLCENSVDRDNNHQSRAENCSLWDALKDADFSGCLMAVRKTIATFCDIRSLRLQMAGIGMTIAAALNRDLLCVDSIIAFSQGALEGTIRELFHDKDDFLKRMLKKHNRVTAFHDPFAGALA